MLFGENIREAYDSMVRADGSVALGAQVPRSKSSQLLDKQPSTDVLPSNTEEAQRFATIAGDRNSGLLLSHRQGNQ